MASRPTYAQLDALAGFLEDNPGIAKGFLRTAQAKMQTKRKWDDFAQMANALGGVMKDGKGWAKLWADKKCVLKKLCSKIAASMRQTGGGSDNLPPQLSAVEERMVSVMGGVAFGGGDRQLSVDPFPATQPLETPPIVEASQQVVLDVRDMPSTSHTPPRPCTPPNQQIRSRIITTPRRSPRVQRLSSQAARNQYIREKERLAAIEEKRVEAELITAQAVREFTEQLGQGAQAMREMTAAVQAVANSNESIATAIYAVAASGENIARAIGSVAAALHNNR